MKKTNSRKARSLCDLAPGNAGIISAIDHDAPAGHRLLAMGLMPGGWLRFLRAAPLGDPLLVELPGALICLRRREAMLIEIEEPIS